MAKPGPSGASQCAVRVAIVLDITGSMGSVLGQCRLMIASLVKRLDSSPVSVEFVLIPYTESAEAVKLADGETTGCFASAHVFDLTEEAEEAVTFVENIKLCQSPLAPGHDASGCDGPENVKAGMFTLTTLCAMPTIAFLITDAPHHNSTSTSVTASHEIDWLLRRGVSREDARDVFRLFTLVEDFYAGTLIVNTVDFGGNQNVHGVFAQRTRGLCMRPGRGHDSSSMAQGLMTVVETLVARLEGNGATQSETVTGFDLLHVEEMLPRLTEQDDAGPAPVVGDHSAIFRSAMEHAESIVTGRGWARRALGMSSGLEQMRFVWLAARYLVLEHKDEAAREEALTELVGLRQEISDSLPADKRAHFSITGSALEARLRRRDEDRALGSQEAKEAVSIVSLLSVGDELEDGANLDDWLESVMRLLFGKPLRVSLPLDPTGKPDFMDAWSAVIQAVSPDEMTCADYMRLAKAHAEETGEVGWALGPSDRERYNAFLITCPPKDRDAAVVFWVASGTQVLNYCSGVSMGAPGFLPNLSPGTAASVLVHMISKSGAMMSEFDFGVATRIVTSLRELDKTPARALMTDLSEGRANPEDHPSKLVTALLRMPGAEDCSETRASAMKLVLEEWLARLIQLHYGKRTAESDAAYLEDLDRLIPLDDLVGDSLDFNPLEALHTLELDNDAAISACTPGWEARAVARVVELHPVAQAFKSCASALSGILSNSAPAEFPSIDVVWPEWGTQFLKLLLLRQRKDRYTFEMDDELGVGTHKPRETVATQALVLERLRQVHVESMKRYVAARRTACEEELMKCVTAICGQKECSNTSGRRLSDQIANELRDAYVRIGNPEPRAEKRAVGPTADLLNLRVCFDRTYVLQIIAASRAGHAKMQV